MVFTLRSDAEARERFEREAMLTGALQHPAIPPVVDRGVLDDGKPFFRMKLIEWNTLADLLSRRTDPDLASLRGPAIRGIPAEERAAWRKLWAKVAAALRSVPAVAPKPHHSRPR